MSPHLHKFQIATKLELLTRKEELTKFFHESCVFALFLKSYGNVLFEFFHFFSGHRNRQLHWVTKETSSYFQYLIKNNQYRTFFFR